MRLQRQTASRLIRQRLPALQLDARRTPPIISELVTPDVVHAPAGSA